MDVQFLGGPKDGEVLTVPDDWSGIIIVVPRDAANFVSMMTAPENRMYTDTIDLPIITGAHGRKYVQWPKGRS